MTDVAQRINTVNLETKVYNVKDLRFTPSGKPVCNARVKLSTQFDDEWHSIWYELAAWDDAADVLADCGHGDEVIVRDGRLKTTAYRTRDGEVRVEGAIWTSRLERVGSLDAGGASRSAPPPPDSDVPF